MFDNTGLVDELLGLLEGSDSGSNLSQEAKDRVQSLMEELETVGNTQVRTA